MIFRDIPYQIPRINWSWYKDIVLACKKRKNKAVFIPVEEVKSAFFHDNVRRAARRCGFKIKLHFDGDGWYVWLDKDKK